MPLDSPSAPSASASQSRTVKVRLFPNEVTDSGWFATLGDVKLAPSLSARVEADWVVVGGGWFGANAARRLAELRPQDSVVLVDAGAIGNNAAGRCAGFAIDLAHNPRNPNFAEDEKGNIEEQEINVEGIDFLRDAVQKFNIQCDWSEEGKTHSAVTQRGEECLVSFAKALDRIGKKYAWYNAAQMKEMVGSSYYTKGLHTPGTVLFQPAALMRGIAANLGSNATVYENTPVVEVIYGSPRHILRTPNGEIHARNVILSGNGFISQFGFYEDSPIPVYTYGSLTRQLTVQELGKIGGRKTYGLIPAESFGTTIRRTADNRLFIRNIYDYVDNFHTSMQQIERTKRSHQKSFDRRFPEISSIGFEHSWGGALCLVQNGGFVFGQLADRVFGAGFCNGTGVSRGAIYGKALAELACGMDSKSIRILLNKTKPSKAYPKLITSLGVKFTTRYRLWKAGAEV
ncbi:MAG: FAD-binding oxidoreductase [Alphaproteobacteria bacterium]|nr:FAD-binding oxidoreductase [Alphaproteobacteria bacterium]